MDARLEGVVVGVALDDEDGRLGGTDVVVVSIRGFGVEVGIGGVGGIKIGCNAVVPIVDDPMTTGVAADVDDGEFDIVVRIAPGGMDKFGKGCF